MTTELGRPAPLRRRSAPAADSPAIAQTIERACDAPSAVDVREACDSSAQRGPLSSARRESCLVWRTRGGSCVVCAGLVTLTVSPPPRGVPRRSAYRHLVPRPRALAARARAPARTRTPCFFVAIRWDSRDRKWVDRELLSCEEVQPLSSLRAGRMTVRRPRFQRTRSRPCPPAAHPCADRMRGCWRRSISCGGCLPRESSRHWKVRQGGQVCRGPGADPHAAYALNPLSWLARRAGGPRARPHGRPAEHHRPAASGGKGLDGQRLPQLRLQPRRRFVQVPLARV